MPTYEITAPDGKRYEVSGDGTAEEALAHFQSQYKPRDPSEYDHTSKAWQDKYGPTSTMGGAQKGLAGFGKAFVDLARGLGQLNVGQMSPQARYGLGQDTAQQSMDRRSQEVARSQQGVIEQRVEDAPLMDSGAAKAGNLLGNVAAAAPTAFIPGANTVAGAGAVGAGLGMLQPAASDQERLMNTGLGAGAGAGGQWLGDKVAGYAAQKLASRKTASELAKAQNVVRDQTLREGMEAGFVTPPATTNPTAANTALESVAGKAATQSAASRINQNTTNRLIRADLGIDEKAPLTRETLKAVRTQAGKAYEAIKESGDVIADEQYLDDIVDIVGGNPEVTKAFPGAKVTAEKEVIDLADSLLQEKFTASAAVEYAKRLRSQAKSNFQSAYAQGGSAEKLQLAHAQWNAAGALEDAIERNLTRQAGAISDDIVDVELRSSGFADIGTTLSKLPPVSSGHTRLFRASSPSTKFDDVFDADGLEEFAPPQGGKGEFYTPDLKYADYYRHAYGKDAVIRYVDVPNSQLAGKEVAPGEFLIDVASLKSEAPDAALENLVSNFRKARTLIAKSYSAEAALNEGTGNIVASKLVQQLRKGKPLSGGFEKIAKFAQVAPKAMKEPTESGGVSALSAMMASGGVALGQPGLVALPVARLLTKRAILSKALQSRALPKYAPSRTGTALLQSSRGLGRIGGPLAASVYATEQ